jgi:hypothetical protein
MTRCEVALLCGERDKAVEVISKARANAHERRLERSRAAFTRLRRDVRGESRST